jgi:peptidoglycan/xylan/chitin deacetylase (PgdA/CDA1 family)
MMKVISAFEGIDEQALKHYLLEDNFQSRFTLQQRIYYSIVRPFVPVPLRQWLQRKTRKDIRWKESFIDDEYVNLIRKNGNNRITLQNLYPQSMQSCTVLTHDVETEGGMRFIPNVIELEKKYGFLSSWNIVPYKYNIEDGIIKLIQDSGGEIGIHGYNHDGKLYYSEKIFTERAEYINEALKKYNAVGFRSPMVHRNLWWLQKLNIEYDSSCFDYDPFQPFPGGTGSIWPYQANKFIELPYTMPQDHVLFYLLQEKSSDVWKKKADWIIQNHGVVLMLTHPDYLSEKNHLKYYEEILQYLSTFKKVWRCLPRELASHFRSILKT